MTTSRRRRHRHTFGTLVVLAVAAAAAAGYLHHWRVTYGIAAALALVAVVLAVVAWIRAEIRHGVRDFRRAWRRRGRSRNTGHNTGHHPRTGAPAERYRERSLGDVDRMTGPQFEQHVAGLLRRDGVQDVRVSGGAGDLGADVVGRLRDGRRIVVQCKRYAPDRTVGSPDMQRFVGTARPVHHADVAVHVGSCRYTAPARSLARTQGIVVVDRGLLSEWMGGRRLTAIVDVQLPARVR